MSDLKFLELFIRSKDGIQEIDDLQRISKLDDDDFNNLLTRLLEDKLIRIDTIYLDTSYRNRYKITNDGCVRYAEMRKVKFKSNIMIIISWIGAIASIIAVIISLFNLLKN